jgi:hypothetical protein
VKLKACPLPAKIRGLSREAENSFAEVISRVGIGRKDHRGVDLISDALSFGRSWYAEPNATSNAKFRSRSHDL